MTATDSSTNDEVAWKAAIAMALALPRAPDWARWAAGWTAPCTCDPYHGDDGFGSRMYHNSKCIDPGALAERGHLALNERRYIEARATPVPAPWDVDAYLADCTRRQVSPGWLPSLLWTDDDGFGWNVGGGRAGTYYVDFMVDGALVATWVSMFDCITWEYAELPREIVGSIYTVVTAAKRAIERRSSPSNEEG